MDMPNDSRIISVSGSSYLIVSQYTNIQIFYIHNARVIGADLSISIGPLGISFPWGQQQMEFRSHGMRLDR